MKRILALVLCAAMAAALIGCGEVVSVDAVETPAGMPNPVHQVSAQELLEETGMSFVVPEGAENVSYSYIDTGTGSNPIAQMSFHLNGADCTARVQGTGIPEGQLPDIAGMYYEWSETQEAPLGYNDAFYYFNPDAEGYVTWYDYVPGLLYSVGMSAGASAEALSALATAAWPPVQGDSDGVVGDGSAMDHMTPAYEPASYLPESALPATLDLNVDGNNETVAVLIKDGDQGFGDHVLVVTDAAGTEHRAETFIQYNSTLCVADIDLDGRFELLLSGDCGSDDYITYAWRWDGELRPIRFSGECRRGGSGEPTDYVDGAVEGLSCDGPEDQPTKVYISLGSFTYMLGTYGSVCTYELSADGAIAPVAPARWDFVGNETWLETAVELPVELDGRGASALPAGTKLRLTSTNGVDELHIQLEDGSTGLLAISFSAESFGWQVAGIDENDAFVSLPYAG